jgi:hypothetical protein
VTDLLKHIQSPESLRTPAWEKTLVELLISSKITLLSDAPQEGPDGFPYLLIETKSDSKESFVEVVNWLATRGIGLVVNPNKAFPDYIFTYGMLWNFKETNAFFTTSSSKPGATFSLAEGDKILAGAPDPRYLPDYVRALLRTFLLDQGVFKPRILVVGKDSQFDLCFSLESLGNPPQAEHHGVLTALSWFLPQHYSLAWSPNKDCQASRTYNSPHRQCASGVLLCLTTAL